MDDQEFDSIKSRQHSNINGAQRDAKRKIN